jgi:hypothetical protein
MKSMTQLNETTEVRPEIIEELRALAEQGHDFSQWVIVVQKRLGLEESQALFPTLAYFRAAFLLSLREVLPLREWLGGRDRSEVDSILIPAINRTRKQWQSKYLQQA